MCLAKQICAFKTEKKRYEQLVREQSSEHHQAPPADDLAVPTERALMANDDDAVKPQDMANSPSKTLTAELPANTSAPTCQDDGQDEESDSDQSVEESYSETINQRDFSEGVANDGRFSNVTLHLDDNNRIDKVDQDQTVKIQDQTRD